MSGQSEYKWTNKRTVYHLPNDKSLVPTDELIGLLSAVGGDPERRLQEQINERLREEAMTEAEAEPTLAIDLGTLDRDTTDGVTRLWRVTPAAESRHQAPAHREGVGSSHYLVTITHWPKAVRHARNEHPDPNVSVYMSDALGRTLPVGQSNNTWIAKLGSAKGDNPRVVLRDLLGIDTFMSEHELGNLDLLGTIRADQAVARRDQIAVGTEIRPGTEVHVRDRAALRTARRRTMAALSLFAVFLFLLVFGFGMYQDGGSIGGAVICFWAGVGLYLTYKWDNSRPPPGG